MRTAHIKHYHTSNEPFYAICCTDDDILLDFGGRIIFKEGKFSGFIKDHAADIKDFTKAIEAHLPE